MATIPKHESAPRKGKKQPQPAVAAVAVAPVAPDLSGIEVAIARFASIVSTYVTNARNNEHTSSVGLFSETDTHPVRVQLESEAIHSVAAEIERAATAFERIATALERKLSD